ncbi:hypothetical protein X275_02965 [Marinitoga sp. 1197]|nr:hypothetical protein X275_02965 [Marinitoga sp. 1197]
MLFSAKDVELWVISVESDVSSGPAKVMEENNIINKNVKITIIFVIFFIVSHSLFFIFNYIIHYII